MSLRIKCYLVIGIPIAGCSLSLGSVDVRNESRATITDVTLSLAGKSIKGGDIDAGGARTISGTPPKDGTMELKYYQDGKRRVVDLGYVTPGLKLYCEVRIANEGAKKDCKAR